MFDGFDAKNLAEGIQRFEYNSVICNGPTSPPDDYGIVPVIDGSKQYNNFSSLRPLKHDRNPESHFNEACQCPAAYGTSRIIFE